MSSLKLIAERLNNIQFPHEFKSVRKVTLFSYSSLFVLSFLIFLIAEKKEPVASANITTAISVDLLAGFRN